MKIEEVIAELRKNPNKQFTDKNGEVRIYKNDYGYMIVREYGLEHNVTLTEQTLHADFEEAKQSVSWQEAIQAWIEGKAIKSIDVLGKERFYRNPFFLRDETDFSVTEFELKNGTWYIL